MKNTLVIGATPKPERYAYQAAEMLLSYGHTVRLLAKRESEALGLTIKASWTDLDLEEIHTITLYLSAKFQSDYYNKILAIKPKRVIFNPGTENPDFYELLNKNNIFYEEACTLVLLRSNQY